MTMGDVKPVTPAEMLTTRSLVRAMPTECAESICCSQRLAA
jgi:hypothetical protein